MDRLNHFGPLSAWRERFFHLEKPLTLTSTEREILFKYVGNLWRYKHQSHRGKVFVCRASRKTRNVDKNKPDYHVPVEKQRNRKSRESVPCPASMVEVQLPGGFWYYERKGRPHSHDLGAADRAAVSTSLRLLERSVKVGWVMGNRTKLVGGEREDWGHMIWQSEDRRKRVRLTYDPIDVMSMYNGVKSKAAGAVVLFSGCTRDNSVPEGEYVQPVEGEEGGPQAGGHTHTIENGTSKLAQPTVPSSGPADGTLNGQGLDGTVLTEPLPLTLPYEPASSSSLHPTVPISTQNLLPSQNSLPVQGTTPNPPPKSTSNSQQPQALPVASLTYSSYVPLALKTLQSIAEQIHVQHRLENISLSHRLGNVPVGEESVVICVSAGHRQEAWRAGEQALEEVKKRVEIWKWEVFQGALDGSDGQALWRSNIADNRIRAEASAGASNAS